MGVISKSERGESSHQKRCMPLLHVNSDPPWLAVPQPVCVRLIVEMQNIIICILELSVVNLIYSVTPSWLTLRGYARVIAPQSKEAVLLDS